MSENETEEKKLRIRMKPFKEYREGGDIYDHEYGWLEDELSEEIKQNLLNGKKAVKYESGIDLQQEK
ncbi:MAG: hypothetical protein ACUZ8E_04185 [Candidatus Anammoxibacter sp.]